MTKVLFTRPKGKIQESLKIAKKMGFDAMGVSSVSIASGDGTGFSDVSKMLKDGTVDVMIFTSSNAVIEFMRHCDEEAVRKMERVKVIAIGTPTQAELEDNGVSVDAIPEEYSSQGLVEYLSPSIKGKKVVTIRSDKGSPVLKNGLMAAGADVYALTAYQITPSSFDTRAVMDGNVDIFAFTSALSSKYFFDHMAAEHGEEVIRELLNRSKVAAIGRPTAEALREIGIEVDIMPPRATFNDLMQEIKENCGVER